MQKKKVITDSPVTERASLVADDVIAETIFDPSLRPPIQYAVFRDAEISLRQSVTVGRQSFNPPRDPNRLIGRGVVLLPAMPVSYPSQAQLVESLRAFIHKYAHVEPFLEELIAHYVLMTWVYDRFTALPYLRFIGEPGTGKSRCLQVAGHLCYKGITAGGSTTASPLFRLIDVYGGTFIIDEADYKNSDEWADITKILNCGYMRGLPVLRSAKSGDDYEPRAYDVFGPKIIANRSRFSDHALETRCITLQTVEKAMRSEIPRQLPVTFYEEARELRNRLLQWRFDNYHRIEPDESKLLHLEPRLTQIGTAIYAVSDDPEFRERFIDFLAESSKEQRFERPQAAVIQAIGELVKGGNSAICVKEVAEQVSCTNYGIEEPMTPKRAGALIRSLGFKPYRTRDGYQFDVDQDRLKELAERYDVNL